MSEPKTDWGTCNISPVNLEEIEKQITEHYKETKQKIPFAGNHNNPQMRNFCKKECPFKKENCQHSCSLITYQIKHAVHKIIGERPNCPKCGKPNPKSAANRWTCTTCGKLWLKQPHLRKVLRPEHPCPECGSIYVKKNGVTCWQCCSCGKSWTREDFKRSFSLVDFPELLNPIVVREVKIF